MRPSHHTSRRNRKAEPEFGDWRVHVEKPHEAEHLRPTPVNVLRRMQVQAAYWQNTDPLYELEATDDWQPVRGWNKAVRIFIGLCVLLPFSIVMVYAMMLQLYHAAPMVGNMDFWQSLPVWYSVLGALLFMAVKYFRLIDPMLVFIYVAGHELTHALAALLCFGKVVNMRVDIDGGYIDTDKDNLFISLSPYFVPIWMLCWLGCFYAVNWIWPSDACMAWFYAGFGFWWTFHIYWTLWVIPREQPDLLENGVVLSFMIIMLANISALLLVLRGFGVISLKGYAQDFVHCAVEIYTTYRELALWIIRSF